MVRIRIGTGWREDPAVRLALVRGGASAAEAAARASDALAIEVEGVDVAAGRAEGPILPTLAALADAVAHLVGGRSRAQVHLPEGAVELLLARRGREALLSVVSLGRPSRVLARDVAVELPALADAVRTAAQELLDELAGHHPAAARSPAGRALAGSLARLAAARPAEPAAAPAPRHRRPRVRRRPASPTCTFEVRDDEGLLASYRGPGADLGSLLAPGQVAVRSAAGEEILSAEGVPFLLLRDLAALGERLCGAVALREPRVTFALALPGRGRSLRLAADLRRGTVTVGGRRSVAVDPLPLARALLEAAVDFCAVVAGRNPWQAENGYLAELRRAAGQALAHLREREEGDVVSAPRPGVRPERAARASHRPLAPGRLRRLAWRRERELDVGAPAGEGLLPCPARGALVAAGARALAALAPDGRPRWRADGAAWAGVTGRSLLVARGPRLSCLDLASGRERWSRALPTPDLRAPRTLLRLRGGPLLLGAGPALVALAPDTGALLWRFEAPGAREVEAAALGALALAAADTGILYALDTRGRLAWRLAAPGAAAAPPLPFGRSCALACAAPAGGAVLAFDPATGRRAWEAALDFAPAGRPVAFAGRLTVPGSVAGDAVVAAVDEGGGVAWTAAPAQGRGSPALAVAGGLLVLRGGDGAAAALDRGGALRWLAPAGPGQPPPPGLPPRAARGVVVLAGDPVRALDAATGELLGQARLPPPARLLVDEELGLTAMDAEGLVVRARLARHLGVVEGRG